MDVIHFPDDPRPPRWQHPVLALGNFDGLHRGHTKIIERLRRVATERGATAVVMTFDPHPPRVVRPDKAPPLLMTKAQRIEALDRAGVDGVAVVRFTPELSQWDPETFVRTVLVEWLHVSEVWVGANFLFGRDRAGNFSMLRSLGARYGFRAEKIDPVRYKEFVVSSTRIRRLISEGRVDEAGALLGHPYAIDGTVVAGDGRGRDAGISDREPGHRERTAAAQRRVCHHGPAGRGNLSVGDQHRRPADLRRRGHDGGRDPPARRPSWTCTAGRCGLGFVQRRARRAALRQRRAADGADRRRRAEDAHAVRSDVALMTFHFDASLPAHRAFLDPLREILRQAFAYVGYPAIEASEMAGAVEALVAQGLPAEPGRGTLRVRVERDAASFHVDVTAPHLPLTPPPVGLMDRVSVHADPGGTRHRFTRHLPGQ